MPFKSDKQRRFLFAKKPKIAHRFALEEAMLKKKRKHKRR